MDPKRNRPITNKTPKNLRVSNEVKLDTHNPIPFEYTGASFQSTGGAYIPFLFPNDNFFSTLQEAALLSPTQLACINTKRDYTIGNGISIKGVDKDNWPEAFKAIYKKANANRQSLNQVLSKAIESFFMTGNAPIEIVKGSVGKKKFVYVYVHTILDCRLGIEDKDSGVIENMLYSKSFRRKGIDNGETGKTIPLYDYGSVNKNNTWVKDNNGTSRTGLWLKNEMVGYDDYGMPSSIASLVHQCIEYQGARYNMDNLENNMVIGGALVIAGNVSQSEADKLGRKIINQHTGSGKRGRIAVFASEAGIEQSKWMPFDTRKEGSFKEQSAEARDVIILSNQWDAVLAGLQSANALGKGAGYLEEIYEQKMNTVITPVVNFFIEHLIGPLAEIIKDWIGEDWTKNEFEILPKQLTSSINTALLYSADGIRIMIELATAVNNGIYPLEAAIKMVSNRFGITIQQAKDELGNIEVKKSYVPA